MLPALLFLASYLFLGTFVETQQVRLPKSLGLKLLQPVECLKSEKKVAGPLRPVQFCPGSKTTCCRYQDQEPIGCTFEADSCAIWKTVPGIRQFVIYVNETKNYIGASYAATECLAGTNQDVVEPAIFQSESRIWSKYGQYARLGFWYHFPAGTNKKPTITVAAVFDPPQKPAVLQTVSSMSYDDFIFTKISLPNLSRPYALRFTADGTCKDNIKLDNIVVEDFTETDETDCLPTTTAPITSTPEATSSDTTTKLPIITSNPNPSTTTTTIPSTTTTTIPSTTTTTVPSTTTTTIPSTTTTTIPSTTTTIVSSTTTTTIPSTTTTTIPSTTTTTIPSATTTTIPSTTTTIVSSTTTTTIPSTTTTTIATTKNTTIPATSATTSTSTSTTTATVPSTSTNPPSKTTAIPTKTTVITIPPISPRSVRVRLVQFEFTPNSEKCDVNVNDTETQGSECESLFELVYTWNGGERTKYQKISEIEDANFVTFGSAVPETLDGPLNPGSTVLVDVRVKDVDVAYQNLLADFQFRYTIPSHPTNSTVLILRDTWNYWHSDMTIEFQTIY